MQKISITGTKGKTTVTRALAFVINSLGNNTLRVDTDGHYINEERKSTLEDSKELFGLVPTVCPGKYLLDMKSMFPDFVAVFETAIGSSGSGGLGYGLHQTGIFLNVLEDHLGSSARLKTRMDIAKAKSFIFSRIDVGGLLVFNADDKYVCSQLRCIQPHKNPILLPFGMDFKYFDLAGHLETDGKYITIEKGVVVLVSKDEKREIIKVAEIKWTFDGFFKPSLFNLMAIIGGLYAFSNGKISEEALKYLKEYQMDSDGGRLTLLENEKGVKILIDYAHEKYSLKEVAKLGKKMKRKRLIGVVRLAPDRPDNVILETGKYIANAYDDIIIYDKIDGINKKRYEGRKQNLTREAGEVSKIFLEGVLSEKKKGLAERIIVEEESIRRAAEISKAGDVVVVICNDDHLKTIEFVKKYFNASLV